MTTFQGSHIHALTNTLFRYAGDFEVHDDNVRWSATVTLDGNIVDQLDGTTSYDLPALDPLHAVLKHLHTQIDAKDYGQPPNVFNDQHT